MRLKNALPETRGNGKRKIIKSACKPKQVHDTLFA